MSDIANDLAALVTARLEDLEPTCRVHVGQVTLEVGAERYREAALRLRDDEELDFGQLVDLCGVDYLHYGLADWKTSEEASSAGFSRGVEHGAHHDPESAASPDRRFAVVSHLLSHRRNRRLRLRVFAAGEPPRVESLVEVWPGANWFEREAFDLFGILFEGHPDLRRILTDYGFVGHPFRKDFPLSGEVEVRYDEVRRRVVYEPVSIEPRTLVPKVIRRDERYSDEAAED